MIDRQAFIKAFCVPGIQIKKKRGVPYYHMDHEGALCRELNGRIRRGEMVDGEFRPYKREARSSK